MAMAASQKRDNKGNKAATHRVEQSEESQRVMEGAMRVSEQFRLGAVRKFTEAIW